jgi:hypothetical protein
LKLRFFVLYAEGVKQISPGQSQATQSRGAALGFKPFTTAVESSISNQSPRPRPKQAAVRFGLDGMPAN